MFKKVILILLILLILLSIICILLSNNNLLYMIFFLNTPVSFLEKEYVNTENNIRFAIVSDPQFFNAHQIVKKSRAVSSILENNNNRKIDFVLFPGDLTDHGFNKIRINKIIRDLFYSDYDDNYINETDTFIYTFIKPLEENNIKTYSTMGNHDTYTGPIIPVKIWICKKHGSVEYKIEYNQYLDIISLGIYPNKYTVNWLRNEINTNKYTILFFHYPPSGAYSGEPWWNDEEKEYFYKEIKKFVLHIC